MNSSLANLSVKQLKRAIAIKGKIDSLQKKLGQILGTPAKIENAKAPRKRWKMSAAARKKIAAAQKARWAKIKAAKK